MAHGGASGTPVNVQTIIWIVDIHIALVITDMYDGAYPIRFSVPLLVIVSVVT